VPAISKHLKNIFDESELEEETTFSILESVGRCEARRTNAFADLNHVAKTLAGRVSRKKAAPK
jgi:hypothetical protein